MRNGPDAAGTAPAPPICGVKKRAATLENTMSAENPCRFGTLTRPAYPGIFERSHSIGNVMGVAPNTLKSYALCVYFQMYSPEKTRYFPKACWSPAWNSLRQPGLNGVIFDPVQRRRGLSTGLPHPWLDNTRFSLKGVSMVRAYETRRTVLVRFTL